MSRKRTTASLAAVAGFFAFAFSALAEVKPASIFTDHMVLQRGMAVPVWGTADANEAVTVTFAGQAVKAAADASGNWRINLAPLSASGDSRDLVIAGTNSVTFHDVVVGEVWVASGQSNMEFTMNSVQDKEKEIAAADHPLLRMFTVAKAVAGKPMASVKGKWEVCTPQTARNFTAVGYFFALDLLNKLNVPVGVIHTSWGGMPAESFTRREKLEADSRYKSMLDLWDVAARDYPANKAKYDQAMKDWKTASDRAKADGKPAPRRPTMPNGPESPNCPAALWNGMVAPLIPYAIRGAIWYQGESNAGRYDEYKHLFGDMITDWRDQWRQGDFPFLFVQLANYVAPGDPGKAALEKQHATPPDTDWARLRESQTLTLALPNTGMSNTIDIGNPYDIHPRNKQDVGHRLALWALADTYGMKVEKSGPMVDSVTLDKSAATITFTHANGLKTTDGAAPKGFAAAGPDHIFHWADAKLESGAITISCPAAGEIKSIRYAWGDSPEVNLVNSDGLPAVSFRSDDWAKGK